MLLSADEMRFLLAACMVSMAVLALVYLLLRRTLTPTEYFGWGLLIVLVPFLGPFLVILLKPGEARQKTARRLPMIGRKL